MISSQLHFRGTTFEVLLPRFWLVKGKWHTYSVRRLTQILVFIVSAAFPYSVVNATPPAWLTEVYHGANYDIYYAMECPADQPDCNADELVPPMDTDGDGHPDRVEEISTFLDDLHAEYVTTFSLNEPHLSTSPGHVYLTGNCGGNYNGSRIRVCAAGHLNVVERKLIHELFHAVQAAYRGHPGWVKEGQANLMTDQVFDRHDDSPNTDYVGSSNRYLDNPHHYALTDVQQRSGYEASLFWKYFAERFGTFPDPGQGMDAIRTFLETATREGVEGIEAVNRTLDALEPGTHFEDIFKDLLIANYAHTLTGASVPDNYVYADEAESLPVDDLHEVHLDVDETIFDAASQVGPLTSFVKAWGARYYRIAPQADVPIVSFNVEQETTSQLYFALLGIQNGEITFERRFVRQHLSYPLVNDINNPYDEVVLIVGGSNHYANYRLNINGQRPVLNIVGPVAARPAYAGDPADPGKFLVMVELLDPDGTPIQDVDPHDFQITVGTQPVPGIITPRWVQGQYWLTVRAPDQTDAGSYGLTLSWATLSDNEPDSVEYATRQITDNVLVIDRSGSMRDFNKMQAAKDAGNLYIDSWPDGDRVGVVSFSSTMSRDFPLDDELDEDSRTHAREAVDDLEASGLTSVGGGLIEGLNVLVEHGDEDHDWAIVLLSDAMQTAGLDITDFWRDYYPRLRDGLDVPSLHAIALGPDADRGDLQALAFRIRSHGGRATFQYAGDIPPESDAGDGVERSGLSAPFETQLALELGEVYRVISETVAHEQQIFVQLVDLDAAGVSEQTIEVPVDAHADEAVFTLSWFTGSSLGYEGSPAASLVGPGGSVPVTQRWDGHLLWRVAQPEEGTWRVRIDCTSIEFCPPHYLVEVSLKSDLTFDLAITPGPEKRIEGLDVFLLAALSDHAPVHDATVNASVIAPSGALHELVLYDDGNNADGAAGDGVYGGRFHKTFEPGSYIVKLLAEGMSNLNDPFIRRARGAFDVAESADSDSDGLPDSYEEAYGSDPSAADGSEDSDLDGLTALREYELGTDPRASDTDHGGEADGSEIGRGSNPRSARDDMIGSHGELYVTPGDRMNFLRFESRPDFDSVVIYRSLSRFHGYSEVARTMATGRYEDLGLTNDQTYWYRVVLMDGGGRVTSPTDPVSGTPRADPVPPEGWVVVNRDEPVTRSRDVVLSLSSADDMEIDFPTDVVGSRFGVPATQMRISNDSRLHGASWELFQSEKSWTLGVEEGSAVVYAEFRDAAGNISETASDHINVELDDVPSGDAASRYSLSLHYGQTVPTGSFGNNYDNDHSLTLDLGYRLNSGLSLVGLLGYNSFDSCQAGVDDTHWWNISANLKYEARTQPWKPYVQGGVGAYLPEHGTTEAGLNIGAGVIYQIDDDWDIDLGLQYHRVLSGGSDPEFLLPSIGVIFRY